MITVLFFRCGTRGSKANNSLEATQRESGHELEPKITIPKTRADLGKEEEPLLTCVAQILFHAASQTKTALLQTLPHSLIPNDPGRGHSASAPGSKGPSLTRCSPRSHTTPRLRADFYTRTHRSFPKTLCRKLLCPEAALPGSSAQPAPKSPQSLPL